MSTLKEKISASLGMIIKWLKDMGLEVNNYKTKICTFHKNLNVKTSVNVDGILVTTSDSSNVLGVEFYSRLQCCNEYRRVLQMAACIEIKKKSSPKRTTHVNHLNFFAVSYIIILKSGTYQLLKQT